MSNAGRRARSCARGCARPSILVPAFCAGFLLLSALPESLSAQQRRTVVVRGATVSQPVLPVRARVPERALTLRQGPRWQPGDPIREVPRRQHGRDLTRSPAAPRAERGLDRLAALQQSEPLRNSEEIGTGERGPSFPGEGYTGVVPPDPIGDVGADRYVQGVNAPSGTAITVFGTDGGELGTFDLADLALAAGQGSSSCARFGFGDPIVLYDRFADRWLLSEFTLFGRLCIYVSTTSDPLSSYWFYEYDPPEFPDYPKYAVWRDGYYAGTNESDPAIYVFDRDAMLAGLPASYQRLELPRLGGFPSGFEALIPAHATGPQPPPWPAPMYYFRHVDDELHDAPNNDTSTDFLEWFTLEVDWNDPDSTVLTGPFRIEVTEFDSEFCTLDGDPATWAFNCLPQPGSGTSSNYLDPISEVVLFRLQYESFGGHESMLGNFVVDVDGNDRGGLRWFELGKSTLQEEWDLVQEGTLSLGDADSRWLGSIARDRLGNVALAYNVTGDATFPGLRYATRRPEDPQGIMTAVDLPIVEGLAANGSTRYGDYNAMTNDPDDPCRFWFTGSYNPAAEWATWITSFTLCTDVFADDFETGDTSAWSSRTP